MLRIEILHHERQIVRAAGRLVGPWVTELANAIDQLPPSTPVVLDLTEVSFADADGLAMLRTIRKEKTVHLRCSAFISAQLA